MHTNSKTQSILMQQVVRDRICLRKMSLCTFNGEGGGGGDRGLKYKNVTRDVRFPGLWSLATCLSFTPLMYVCTLSALVDLAWMGQCRSMDVNDFSFLKKDTPLTAFICRTLCITVMAFPAYLEGSDELSNSPSNARNRFPKNLCTPSPPKDIILLSMALTQASTLIAS